MYHDVEESEYDNKHPEIFKDEKPRWEKINRKFFAAHSEKICLLDVGSGTGFVPLQIGKSLNSDDLLVCSDISPRMLQFCKKRINEKGFKCHVDYLLLDGKKIDLKPNMADFITMNSVLHHIPDFSTFFREINRVLKVNGRLIIGHEPNKLFYTHRFLWSNYRLISFVLSWKFHIAKAKRKFKPFKILKEANNKGDHKAKSSNRIADEVNERLLEERIIDFPLTIDQIIEIVDIHSPTAERGKKSKTGIDAAEILEVHLPNFRLDYLETYNYLGKVSSANQSTMRYDSLLRRIYPGRGATFLAILKKIGC
ncbi:MAG: class I SAM-dependent methyltransferase [Candidatus Heimdallarchaeota archaeon]